MKRLAAMLSGLLLAGCVPSSPGDSAAEANPIRYVEIPATDLDRAERFYGAVFGVDFERAVVDGYDMALFPFAAGGPGAMAALAKGDAYTPSRQGAIVYFTVADIDAALAQAKNLGAEVLYPKKDIGEAGIVAEIEDSEGKRIALHQPREWR